MKTLTTRVQIQFDQLNNEDSKEYVIKVIDEINEILQKQFNDISPIIFANSIDSSDIEISIINTD